MFTFALIFHADWVFPHVHDAPLPNINFHGLLFLILWLSLSSSLCHKHLIFSRLVSFLAPWWLEIFLISSSFDNLDFHNLCFIRVLFTRIGSTIKHFSWFFHNRCPKVTRFSRVITSLRTSFDSIENWTTNRCSLAETDTEVLFFQPRVTRTHTNTRPIWPSRHFSMTAQDHFPTS